MGAAASLTQAGLPERMSRADLQALCAHSHKYTEAQFLALSRECMSGAVSDTAAASDTTSSTVSEAVRSEEPYITREQFIAQVVAEQERECERLFESFSCHNPHSLTHSHTRPHSGRSSSSSGAVMDEEHLLSFLRHCKLLSKSGFSVHDARALFHQLLEEAAATATATASATATDTTTDTTTTDTTTTDTTTTGSASVSVSASASGATSTVEKPTTTTTTTATTTTTTTEKEKEKSVEKKSVEQKSVEVATVLDAHGQVQRVVYVNYRMFREGLLPVLAAKKGLAMDRVMFLLSRCEASTRMISGELVVTDTYNPADENDTSVERSVHLLVNEKEDAEKKKERKLSAASEELIRSQATQVIQSAARKRNARKKHNKRKLLRAESTRVVDDSCFCNEDYNEFEEKIKNKFLAFASQRSAEMDFKQFHSWLIDCGWYISHPKFTKGDADVVFRKAMARASVPSAGLDLNIGVVMNKRVHFLVFRKAIIKVLAEEANINTNDVIFILLDCDDPE